MPEGAEKSVMNILWKKYKKIISYLFFGGCTTVLNIFLYYCFRHVAGFSLNGSNIAAWTGAVIFAYATNRKWVFGSGARGISAILGEICRFFACRGATGVLDVAFMYISVEKLNGNDVLMKVISNILVIIVNYAASKLFIFQKEKGNNRSEVEEC